MSGRQAQHHEDSPSFETRFPTIARWITQEEGWVEIGADHNSDSAVRALYGGGMVWEGTEDYRSLDEALRAMDAGIAAWLAANRPDERQQQSKSRLKSPRAARQPVPTASARQSPTREGKPPAVRKVGKNDGQSPRAAYPAVPRAVVGKIRKFAELAAALRAGENFGITRLTSVKSLCKAPETAQAFALFLASVARQKMKEMEVPERYNELMDRGIAGMQSFLAKPDQEQKQALSALLGEIVREQNEYRYVRSMQVRSVDSMELIVVENTLKSLLRPEEAPFWLYQASRDYAECYDSRYGTGLIPSSAPMMQAIADFWANYYGIDQ